jgi:two-component system LytT family response regulator
MIRRTGSPRAADGANLRSVTPQGDVGLAKRRADPSGGAMGTGDDGPKKLMLKVRGRMILLDEAAIDWIDAAGNYVRFNVGDATYQVRGTLKDVEQLLAPARFLRVHRSTIVNIDAVAEFIRGRYGDLAAVLKGGKRLTVGRRYRRAIVAALQAIAGVLS